VARINFRVIPNDVIHLLSLCMNTDNCRKYKTIPVPCSHKLLASLFDLSSV